MPAVRTEPQFLAHLRSESLREENLVPEGRNSSSNVGSVNIEFWLRSNWFGKCAGGGALNSVLLRGTEF